MIMEICNIFSKPKNLVASCDCFCRHKFSGQSLSATKFLEGIDLSFAQSKCIIKKYHFPEMTVTVQKCANRSGNAALLSMVIDLDI